jgi:hypothetical protein
LKNATAHNEGLFEKKVRLSDRSVVYDVGMFPHLVRDILTAGVVAILCTFQHVHILETNFCWKRTKSNRNKQ